MSDISLAEAAERTGKPLDLLRKHAQRGKLRTAKAEDGKVTVDEADLELYIAGGQLGDMGAVAHSVAGTTKPAPTAAREIGNLFGQLPPTVQNAILDGIPTSKRQGGPEAFDKATKRLPKHEAVPETSDDPHFGHPVGYRHRTAPRWGRVSGSTWELDGATWSHNGLFWEGGGLAAGRSIDDDISPAAPASDRRPLGPPKPVKR